MRQLGLFFDKIQEAKSRAREIQSAIKDSIAADSKCVGYTEEIKRIQAARKAVVDGILAGMATDVIELEREKEIIKEERENASVEAVQQLLKGKPLEKITDENGVVYQPVVSIKFVKDEDQE